MLLLKVESINVFYNDFHVLKDVSIEINETEVVSLVGANSAGKTTLLRTISGEISEVRGDIIFRQKSILRLDVHEIVRMGIVQIPEGRRIFPLMTVFENLCVGSALPEPRRKRYELLDKVFELFPILKERENQLAGTLSGGEQQMLAIARGLMVLPKLLMFDEPSNGLAPIIVEAIFKVIKQINNQGITTFLVEQNVQKSLSIANRGYIIENGKIIMEGTGAALLANPYVKEAYLGL
jgi:branched-chain amino acid transport system ATP-binding protein